MQTRKHNEAVEASREATRNQLHELLAQHRRSIVGKVAYLALNAEEPGRYLKRLAASSHTVAPIADLLADEDGYRQFFWEHFDELEDMRRRYEQKNRQALVQGNVSLVHTLVHFGLRQAAFQVATAAGITLYRPRRSHSSSASHDRAA